MEELYLENYRLYLFQIIDDDINGFYCDLPTTEPEKVSKYFDRKNLNPMPTRGIKFKYQSIKSMGLPVKIRIEKEDEFNLNSDQINSINDIERWLKDENNFYYTLSGFAGTGKTTSIRELIR